MVELRIPALRERGDDVLEIANAMLKRACEKMQQAPTLQRPNPARHSRHNWPGNVRELENAVERAVILADEDEIDASQLGIEPDNSPDRHLSASMRANLVETPSRQRPQSKPPPLRAICLWMTTLCTLYWKTNRA